jgi:hypothetical protein
LNRPNFLLKRPNFLLDRPNFLLKRPNFLLILAAKVSWELGNKRAAGKL